MAQERLNLAEMTRSKLAHLVRTSSTDELDHMMRGPERTGLLDWIFADMPHVFRPDRAAGVDATIHWRITDGPDGSTDTRETVITAGTCTVSASPQREPALTLTMNGADFLRMVSGNANPMSLFLRGRMKSTGELGLAVRVAGMFDRGKN